jgi:hypothetical protein
MRRPTSGIRGWLRSSSSQPPPQPEEPPAPRRQDFEERLRQAIRDRVRVQLRYDDDFVTRLFEPTAVYWSSQEQVCVTGIQIVHPTDPSGRQARDFKVGKITALTLTEDSFVPERRFDRFDPKYDRGIICSV